MSTIIPQRDLRNDNAEVVRRVSEGETFVITRRGEPVAELRPYTRTGARRFVSRASVIALAQSWQVDAERTGEARIDAIIDQSVHDPYGRRR